jgi:phage terminase large subunit
LTRATIKPDFKFPRAFQPILQPARYKGIHGGRGSAKSHSTASYLVLKALTKYSDTGKGLRWACLREVQKTLKESAKKLLEDKIQEHGVGHLFDVQADRIITPGGGVLLFQGMKDHNAESIKSLEDMDGAWVEEAQAFSQRSNTLLRPTIRGVGSELIYTWNPRRKTDEVDSFLRSSQLEDAIVVEMNWRDNPWFPDVLEQERLLDQKMYPERYDHIWEGEYATAMVGAYYAEALTAAKQAGRIGRVSPDPLLTVRSYHDIGGAGAKADAYTIWVVQFVNHEIRVLDYYESQGQTLSFHVNWMRDNGWEKAQVRLPHDGTNTNNITGKKYRDHWEDAGFDVTVIPNQGQGAAMQRIEAARRVFSQCWFNEETTEAGREALGFYHEKRDEQREIGLGPDHDWSSHAADAFGLMAIDYAPPHDSSGLLKNLYGKANRRGSFLNS